MSRLHNRQFPNESSEYRQKRNELLAAEQELRQKILDVAELRRELPKGGELKEDYLFDEVDLQTGATQPVRFSALFNDHSDSLIAYNLMYGPDWERPCSSCTSIVDAGNGMAPHIRAKTNYVIIAKASPDKLFKLAKDRNWQHIRLLSSLNNRFNEDYLAQPEGKPESQNPLLHSFVKRDGKIYHHWSSELMFVSEPDSEPQHVDLFWPLWHYLDITVEGRGNFDPSFSYGDDL